MYSDGIDFVFYESYVNVKIELVYCDNKNIVILILEEGYDYKVDFVIMWFEDLFGIIIVEVKRVDWKSKIIFEKNKNFNFLL